MTKINEPMDRTPIVEGESFWVLQIPGTQQTVMSIVNGKAEGPIVFSSEDDAIKFANQYKVSDQFVPVHHTAKFRKSH